MEKLSKKSRLLTGYLEYLLDESHNDAIQIITPKEPDHRGAQLSIRIKNSNKGLFQLLMSNGVICDWREPDVIRVAPAPLYNSFMDVFQLVQKLKNILKLLPS